MRSEKDEHPFAEVWKVKPGWQRLFDPHERIRSGLKVVSIVYSWKRHNTAEEEWKDWAK